jgi:hypothetical protein
MVLGTWCFVCLSSLTWISHNRNAFRHFAIKFLTVVISAEALSHNMWPSVSHSRPEVTSLSGLSRGWKEMRWVDVLVGCELVAKIESWSFPVTYIFCSYFVLFEVFPHFFFIYINHTHNNISFTCLNMQGPGRLALFCVPMNGSFFLRKSVLIAVNSSACHHGHSPVVYGHGIWR